MKNNRQSKGIKLSSRILASIMVLLMISTLILPMGAKASETADGSASGASQAVAEEHTEKEEEQDSSDSDAKKEEEEKAEAAETEEKEQKSDSSADTVSEDSSDSRSESGIEKDESKDESGEESAQKSKEEAGGSDRTSGKDASDTEEDKDTGKSSNTDQIDSEKTDSGNESGKTDAAQEKDASSGKSVEAGTDAGSSEETAEQVTAVIENDETTITFQTEEVTVIADKKAFDTEVTMEVKKVTDPEQLLKMVTALQEEGGSYTVKAYNVSFYDQNGKEVEPKIPVQVNVNTKVSAPKKTKVVHVKDNDKTEILDADIDRSGASFELGSFSDIGVATEGKAKIPGSSFDLYLGDELTTDYTVDDLPAGPISEKDFPAVDGYTYENATVGEDQVEEIGTITDEEGNVYVYYTTRDENGTIKAEILGDGRIRINLVETDQDTTYDLEVDGTRVRVEAPADAFDEGTYMEISTVELTGAQQAQVREQVLDKLEPVEDSQLRYQAVDITFFDKDGQKVQPNMPVNVTFTTPETIEGNFCVVHLGDDDSADRVEAARSEEGSICFTADRFSVYVVVDDNTVTDESRMTLKFWNMGISDDPGTDEDERLLATVYVKNDDDEDDLEIIIFDPGIGEVPSNSLFKGWSLDEPGYSVESADSAMDIADIRTWAKEKADNDSIYENEEHNFYAMVYQTYSVAFQDEDGATIHGEALIFKPGEEVKYDVNTPYTPRDQDSQFQGWYATTSDSSAVVTTEDGTPIGTAGTGPIPNMTTVVISSDTTFTPNSPKGYWLVFNSNTEPNTSRASYTPPQFVMENAETVEPDPPTRVGYRFDGWYTDSECTDSNKFTFGQTLSGRTELYAKWTPVSTANYTVIIWQQNVDATGYDFVEAVTLSGNTGTTVNTVTKQGTGDSAYARVNNVNKQYTGFHLKEFDQNITITPEGNAVLNVYYDRTEYTLRFFYARSYEYNVPGQTSYRQIGTSTNGNPQGFSYNSNNTYWGYRNDQYIQLYYRTSNGRFYRNSTYSNSYSGNVYLQETTPAGTHKFIQVNANNEGFLRHNGGTLNGSLSYYLTNDYQRLTNGNTWKDVNNSSVNGNPLNLVSSDYLAKPEVTDGSIQINNVTTDVVTNSTTSSKQTVNTTYYYLDVKVRYGQTLEDLWPNPATTFNGQDLTTYNRPHNSNSSETSIAPLLTGSWASRNNISGIYQQMTTDLFVGNDTIAYFDIYWRLDEYYHYTYNVYFSTLEGETGEVTYKGNQYVLHDSYDIGNGVGWGTFDPNASYPADGGSGFKDVTTVTFDGTNVAGRVDSRTGSSGSDGTINVYYDRKIHNIIYHDGIYVNGDNGTIKNLKDEDVLKTTSVIFGQDISSYAEGEERYFKPAAPEGFVFEGWYMDSEGQQPYTFSGTMPDKDIEVYAKWRQVQYRVFLHPNVPEGADNLDWGGQSMSFRVNEGEKIGGGNKIIGTADGYEFIGWYTDPACTQSFEMSAVELRDDTVTTPYDTTDDGMYNPTDKTELDDRGNPTSNENKDAVEERYWITKKLDLYGKWRATLDGAKGIRVVYNANSLGDDTITEDDIYGHFTGGATTYTDPLAYYLDRAEANAAGASIPNDTDKYQFMHWVVQKWDSSKNKYVDTNDIVYPGDTFEVLKAYARVEDIPGAADPENNKTYTVQLRAEYGPKDAPTPTHIWWFPNNVAAGTVHNASAADNNLQINQAVSIEPAPNRSGYKFLGWARVENTTSQSVNGTPPTGKGLDLTEADLFLKYVDGVYKAEVDGEWKTVTEIAADEHEPYHDMYAVWEKTGVNIKVNKIVAGNMADITKSFTFTAVLTDGTIFEDQGSESGITLSSDKKSATFSLKNGESVTIAGVPSLAAMTITETNADEYTTTATGIVEGTLDNTSYSFTVPEQDSEVTFTNTKTAVAPTQLHSGTGPMAVLVALSLGALILMAAHHFIDRFRHSNNM